MQVNVHKAPWTEELSYELRAEQRSISRGVGPSKQSFPLDIAKVLKLEPVEGALVPGGPIGALDFASVGLCGHILPCPRT